MKRVILVVIILVISNCINAKTIWLMPCVNKKDSLLYFYDACNQEFYDNTESTDSGKINRNNLLFLNNAWSTIKRISKRNDTYYVLENNIVVYRVLPISKYKYWYKSNDEMGTYDALKQCRSF